MRFTHPAHPGKSVRLAYCLNVHPATDIAGVVGGIEQITVPLRERLAPGRDFGVGLYLPAALFAAGAGPERESGPTLAERLGQLCARHRLDPFTFNAFPFGDFHGPRLKERVFEPTWFEDARARWTLAVASLAAQLPSPSVARGHTSISTHTGMHSSSPRAAASPRALGECFGAMADQLSALPGPRTLLGLEPEPRANCGDTQALQRLFEQGLCAARPRDLVERHLGVCLDTCHAAVEFEAPAQALDHALASGAGLVKLQLTNAVRLLDPLRNHAGREALFAMAEPRYLHQVTGRGPAGLVRAGDLAEVQGAFLAGDESWRQCEEWRCHFHVPVDRTDLGVPGLWTTRDLADEAFRLALREPRRWGRDELHAEIETYTWEVLQGSARGAGALVDGLEREYRHALQLLALEGWTEETAGSR